MLCLKEPPFKTEGYLGRNSKCVNLHFLTVTKLPGIDNLNEEYLSPMNIMGMCGGGKLFITWVPGSREKGTGVLR